jgi:hypothetical protein
MSPSDNDDDNDDQFAELRIDVSGRWSADDLSVCLRDLSGLYALRLVLDYEPDSLRYLRRYGSPLDGPWWGTWLPANVGGAPLDIVSIEYSSPGYVIVKGLKKSLKRLGTLLEQLVTLDKIRERKGLENDALRLENAKTFIQVRAEARQQGMTEAELIGYLLPKVDGAQERFQRLIASGNITGVLPANEGAATAD